MRPLRVVIALVVPASLVLAAFASAKGVSALIEATVSAAMVMPSLGRGARASVAPAGPAARSADAILDRNPFDHVAGSLRPRLSTPDDPGPRELDPAHAPPCEGVRPVVVVGDEDQDVAFASLEVGGRHVLRKRGGEVGEARVAYVGRDRVWLEGARGLCQALLFGGPVTAPPPSGRSGAAEPAVAGQSALESAIGKQIVKTGPNEYAIDRGAVERILEAQQELMKQRLVPHKEGDQVVGLKVFGVKPGSVLAMLGIENGDRLETVNGYEVTNPEKMLEAYARLRTGADRLQVHLTRAGKPLNLDYAIR